MKPVAGLVALAALPAALVALAAGSSARAAQAPPAHAALAGAWKVDRQQLPDDQDVWRRRVDALAADAEAARPIDPHLPDPLLASPTSIRDGLGIAQLRTAMRDLLETAERLSFAIAPDSVTITDDLKRALTFATTGKKEKRQLGATEFTAKTRWNGQALAQTITAWSLELTEVYLPQADGRAILLSIAIDKPEFQPAIKPITRRYTRIK